MTQPTTHEELLATFEERRGKPEPVPPELQPFAFAQLRQLLLEASSLATKLLCCQSLNARYAFALDHIVIDALHLRKAIEEIERNGQPT